VKRPIKRSLWVLAVSLLTALAVALTSPGKGSAAPTPHPLPQTTTSHPKPKPTPPPKRSEHDDGHSDKGKDGRNRDQDDNEHKKKRDDDDRKKKKKKDDDDHHHHGKYPPPPPHHCSISNPSPKPGSHVQLGAAGFRRGESVHIRIHSAVQVLGVTTADSAGQAVATVAIPANFTGQHELTMTGDVSGYTNTIAIQLSAPVKASAASAPTAAKAKASGHASPVGAVTAGIGALGLVLLSGAGALLAIGRRRKARANILA
jgi:hypothetical protein